MLVVLPESKSFYSAHDVAARCRVWSQHRHIDYLCKYEVLLVLPTNV